MTNVELCPIFVDYREGSKALLEIEPVKSLIDRNPDGTPVSYALPSDVMIVGNGPNDTTVTVGIEVKSLYDLMSSINTGRLQATQLPALLTHDVQWLLYYGTYRPGRDGQLEIRGWKNGKKVWRAFRLGTRNVPYGYLESQLFDLACEGVNIKHVYDEKVAAVWIAALHRWWSKRWSQHKGLRMLDSSHEMSLMPSMSPRMKQRVKIARQLPAVGFEKAMAAAAHFPSVRAMINADVTEWGEVAGIGKVIAKAVEQAVTEEGE